MCLGASIGCAAKCTQLGRSRSGRWCWRSHCNGRAVQARNETSRVFSKAACPSCRACLHALTRVKRSTGLASRVSAELLDKVQIELASAAASRFKLSTNVLAYDTTNFDTYIATTTTGKLAQRGHAKSKRRDPAHRRIGGARKRDGPRPVVASHMRRQLIRPSGPRRLSDDLLGLHNALDQAQGRRQPAARTLVRDGGFWSEQLELELEFVGYYSIISLPLGHGAAKWTLDEAAKPRAMRRLKGQVQGRARCAFQVDDRQRKSCSNAPWWS